MSSVGRGRVDVTSSPQECLKVAGAVTCWRHEIGTAISILSTSFTADDQPGRKLFELE